MPKDSEFYLFSDIDKSCTEEIRRLGIHGDVKLVKGGIELSFHDAPPVSFAPIEHLPIKGFDFSNIQMPSSDEWRQFPIKSLALPSGMSFKFEDLDSFQLKKLIAEGVQSEDFEELATHPLSFLSIPKSNLQQIEFLAAMNFQYLNLAGTVVDCLQPLESSTDLEELDIFKCKTSKGQLDNGSNDSILVARISKCLSGISASGVSSWTGLPERISLSREEPASGLKSLILHLKISNSSKSVELSKGCKQSTTVPAKLRY